MNSNNEPFHLVRALSANIRLVKGWGANASWEFDSKYAPDSYHRWVTSKLRPDYRVGETANSGLRFSKYAHGDEETLSLETASSSGTLHVAVKLEIYPD